MVQRNGKRAKLYSTSLVSCSRFVSDLLTQNRYLRLNGLMFEETTKRLYLYFNERGKDFNA